MNTSFLLRRLLPALVVVALVAGGYFWNTRSKPVAVVLKTVERGKVESTVVNTRAGTVEACQRTKLSTIMGGRIEYLGVKEGDKVKKGQLLLKLWNDDQKAQQVLAEAQRAMAAQRVKEVCTTAASSRREAERQASLKNKGFVSDAREDTARSEADTRAAACETAKADVAQAAARVGVTRVEQGRMVLYAPFDGTVAKIVGELGEYSTPSPPGVPTPPAIDLIDESCLYVKAPMDEVDAPRIVAGLPVRVSLDALPKQALNGKVRRVAPYVLAVEKQARTVDVEVDFERPAGINLLVGYSADVEIVLSSRADVLRVPTATLIEGGKVMVLNAASGRLEERKVKTGTANWEFTEIVEGLAEGERIVMSLEREGVKVGARATAADAAVAQK
ncbi:efflux RND transporter periplasmic adaptor subunit [Sulfuritalea sp.]|uniref:efflux RND transporter periplasmic adaptor subunit n=1 Tax=Sulfuritalea sp. TaxID=2480090 RepID=UPI001AC36DFA|nr:efflux RND transporter periplasmic adaptor subunit [Sulfuritalea sp.]MBN8474766.1 efflux RND transporter periplasmic adaptor subunit [Sulfuritalea sp.]